MATHPLPEAGRQALADRPDRAIRCDPQDHLHTQMDQPISLLTIF